MIHWVDDLGRDRKFIDLQPMQTLRFDDGEDRCFRRSLSVRFGECYVEKWDEFNDWIQNGFARLMGAAARDVVEKHFWDAFASEPSSYTLLTKGSENEAEQEVISRIKPRKINWVRPENIWVDPLKTP